MPSRNRAILLTAPNAAAIAVVRAAGPAVPAFLAAAFSRSARVGRAVHGELRDRDRVIDDPVIALLDETTADINLHGGPWVVQATLDLLGRSGFDVTRPDPNALPDEAVDGDEEIEREVMQALPLARTELGVRALLAQPARWREFFDRQSRVGSRERRAPARLSEEPGWCPAFPGDAVAAILADRTMDRLLRPASVAIVGAANVGKSTLANRLFGRERSITADLPGTTRDWVGEIASVAGVPVMLLDTPGLRTTDDAIERAAIAAAEAEIRSVDLVVVVLDASRALDDEQREPLARFLEALVVANKVDRPAAWDVNSIDRDIVPVVATTGAGIDELVRRIHQSLVCDVESIDRVMCWTERQRKVLAGCVQS